MNKTPSDVIGRSDTDESCDGNHHHRKSSHLSVNPLSWRIIGWGVNKVEQ